MPCNGNSPVISRITNQGITALQMYYIFRLFKSACLCFITILQFYQRGAAFSFSEYIIFIIIGFFTVFDTFMSILGCCMVHINKYKKIFRLMDVIFDREYLFDTLIPFQSTIWQFYLLKLPENFQNSKRDIAIMTSLLYLMLQYVSILYSILAFSYRLINGMPEYSRYIRLIKFRNFMLLFDIVVTSVLLFFSLNFTFLSKCSLVMIWCMAPFINNASNSFISLLFYRIYYTEYQDPFNQSFNILSYSCSKVIKSRIAKTSSFLLMLSIASMYLIIYPLHPALISLATLNVFVNYLSFPMLLLYTKIKSTQ